MRKRIVINADPHETRIAILEDDELVELLVESGDKSRSVVDAGRGTEVFVRRDGKWLDVGWHLDNGPFVRKDGEWIRVGEPYPEPSVRGAQ